jgi:hypothetical protein
VAGVTEKTVKIQKMEHVVGKQCPSKIHVCMELQNITLFGNSVFAYVKIILHYGRPQIQWLVSL